MALTRKMLKAMGIEEEKIEQIIEAHTESIDVWKEKASANESAAADLDAVRKELDELKGKADDGYKDKFEKEHEAFENYKSDIAAKETKTAKTELVRKYFESQNITGKNLDLAMRGCQKEIDGIEIDDGKIKDDSALRALIDGEYSVLIHTDTHQGTNTENPPANGGHTTMTKADILAIKDTAARQKAIAENASLFGIE